jgi:hypothetical protein
VKRDPIEETQEFAEALKKIQPQLDKINAELEEIGMGRCHTYWARKKELLKSVGIDWKSPAECNPYIIFD